jgi:hypothetical protein
MLQLMTRVASTGGIQHSQARQAGKVKSTSLLIHKAGREQSLTVVLCRLAIYQPPASFFAQEQRAWTGLRSISLPHSG